MNILSFISEYILEIIFLLVYTLLWSNNFQYVVKKTSIKLWEKSLFLFKRTRFGRKTADNVQESVKEALDEQELEEEIEFVDNPKKAEHWDEVCVSSFRDEKELSEYLSRYISEEVAYRKFKKHMSEDYKSGFELALSARVAKKLGHDEIISEIDSKAEEENLVYEYELFDDILGDGNKREIFKGEAKRREKSYRRGSPARINKHSKKEFCDIIDKLTGSSKIIIVKHSTDYLRVRNKAKSFLEKENIDTVFILGRGDSTLETMNEIKKDLRDDFPNVSLSDRESYKWETDYGEEYGKLLVLEK